jgi:hypothetical protein
LRSKFVPNNLDIVELRAVYYCLPNWKKEQDGTKREWRENLKYKLNEMAHRETLGELLADEIRNSAYKVS